MPDPRPSSQDSWRDIGPIPAHLRERRRPWQSGSMPALKGDTRWFSKRGKRIFAALSLAFLSIALGIVFRWLSPFKSCLVTIGSGYESNLLLPHNVHGYHGLTQLEELTEADKNLKMRWPWQQPDRVRRAGNGVPRELAPDNTWPMMWEGILKEVSSARTLPFFAPSERTLLLAISLHAIVENGEIYFLANDPRTQSVADNADRTQTRVAFNDILASIKALPRRHVLLLLDIGQFDSYWPIGVFHSEVAERLEKHKDEIDKMGNLVVISSMSKNQRGWVSDEWQSSMFLHFVNEGLRGAASKDSSRVNALSLFKYVEKRVDEWAQVNRARSQKPMLLGKPGLAERVEIVHAPPSYVEQNGTEAPGHDFTKEHEDKIRARWHKWRELRQLAPYAFGPHRWRVYQETLVRYEQLLRAGDPTGKGESALRQELVKLENEISERRTLKEALRCQESSFPMARVLGHEPLAEPELQGIYRKFVAAENDNLKRSELKAWGKKCPDQSFARVQLGKKVLAELHRMELPLTSTDVWQRDSLIEEGLSLTRPAELHLLKMLTQEKHPDLPEESVKLALRMRILAEETALSAHPENGRLPAYLYSEVIFPRFKTQIEAADDKRRWGEDLLFGQPQSKDFLKNHEDEAKKLLNEAGEMYAKALGGIKELQYALAVRDEACGELPYFTQWIAHFPIHGAAWSENREKLQGSLKQLCAGLGELTVALDDADAVPDLQRLARQVQNQLQRLQLSYDEIGQRYPFNPTQSNWHELDNALSIPCVRGEESDVALRMALLDKLRKTSGHLAEKPLDSSTKERPEQLIEPEELLADRVARQSEALRDCLAPFRIPCEGKKAYMNMVLRSHLLALDTTINTKSKGKPAETVEAANLCRIVPAGLSGGVRSRPYHPVEQLRRVRMHKLLMWQARRTWGDHWFDPGQNQETPYYLPFAKAFCDAARELIKELPHPAYKKELEAEMGPPEKQFTSLALLKGAVTKTEPWTEAQSQYPLTWPIKLDGDVPRGKPIWWVDTGGGKVPRRLDIAWRTDDKVLTARHELDRRAIWGTDFQGKRPVSLHAIYRGQHLYNKIQFEGMKADVIVHELPRRGSLSVATRMDARFNYGAVAILLDTSASMLYAPGTSKDAPEGTPDRFHYAVTALKEVLEKVPDGTELSLFTFYEATNLEGGAGTELFRKWKLWDRKEHLDKLVSELKSFKNERKPHPRDPKRLIYPKINNNSPIARGIVTCMEEGFSKKDGPKVVIALTDGADNCSVKHFYFIDKQSPDERARMQQYQKINREGVQKMLKEANEDHLGIDVVVVSFMDDMNEEYPDAKEQFRDIENFRPKVKGQRTKSKFTTERDGKKLGATILKMIQPRMELRDESGNIVEGFRDPDHVIDRPGQAPRWVPVPPGYYTASLPGVYHTPQDLRLDSSLFLLLKRKDLRFYLERGLLCEQPELAGKDQWTRTAPNWKDWKVTLLENSLKVKDARNYLQQLLAFENVKTAPIDDVPSVIDQPRPGFVWLELGAIDKASGKETKLKQTIHWKNAQNVAAPAYYMQVPNWPDETASKLTTWFWPKSAELFLKEADLVDQAFLEMNPAGVGNKFAMPGIESISWDPEAKDPVLVVQCKYELGKPVMVRFADTPGRSLAKSAKHYYFHDAGRCTAFFYGLPASFQAKLAVVDLAAFKLKAERIEFNRPDAIDPPAVFLSGDPVELP